MYHPLMENNPVEQEGKETSFVKRTLSPPHACWLAQNMTWVKPVKMVLHQMMLTSEGGGGMEMAFWVASVLQVSGNWIKNNVLQGKIMKGFNVITAFIQSQMWADPTSPPKSGRLHGALTVPQCDSHATRQKANREPKLCLTRARGN